MQAIDSVLIIVSLKHKCSLNLDIEKNANHETKSSDSIVILFYLGESKVLQYLRNLRHHSAAADTFAEVVKWWLTLDYEMPSSPDTFRGLLARFSSSMTWSTVSEPTIVDRHSSLSF